MAKLYAFGCSNTVGEWLPDTLEERNGELRCWLDCKPSQYAWPAVLAEKMQLKCVNLGVPGNSNKNIWKNVVDTNINCEDTVVILWTFYSRTCVFQDDDTVKRIMVHDIDRKDIEPDVKHLIKTYFKNFYTDKNAVYESYMYASWVKMFLDNKNIKNYHFSCHLTHNRSIELEDPGAPDWSCVKFPDIKFKGIGEAALDGMHPGILSHKQMAMDMFSYIYQGSKDDL